MSSPASARWRGRRHCHCCIHCDGHGKPNAAFTQFGWVSGGIGSIGHLGHSRRYLLSGKAGAVQSCVIVMDNASFHKRADMIRAIKQAGHRLLFLPPYSPDLNPIEKKWAQAKAFRKKLQCSIDQVFCLYNL